MEQSSASSPETYPAVEPQEPRLNVVPERMADRLGFLDPVAQPLARLIRNKLGSGRAKELLSGRWLGHPLHPSLTDVVIGCWASATILDLVAGRQSEKAARILTATGIAAAGPTVASGWSDWADTSVHAEVRRVGVIHALTNATAIGLYATSLGAGRHSRPKGALLRLAGAGLLGFGGYLGGHLAHARGVGVDQTAFEHGPTEWTPVLAADELQEGGLTPATADGVRLLLARADGRLVAMSDRCTHRGGALHEGELEDGCVTCPLHGSVFRLADGSVVSGPATSPQPIYDVRLLDGQVEVRAVRAPLTAS